MWKIDPHMSQFIGRKFKVKTPTEAFQDDFTVMDGLEGVLLVQSTGEMNLVLARDLYTAINDGIIGEDRVKTKGMFG